MGFFNFNEFLAKHNIDFWNKSTLLCLVGERNVGKTTSPLTEMMERASPENKILIIRITQQQLKMQIQDFNNRFKGKYTIIGGMVYSLKPYAQYNKVLDQDEISYKRDQVVGYVGDINNYQNYKSVEAKDVKMIFFDECIQLQLIPFFYEKLMNMLMTFARFNNPSILLVGNRDTPNNEFMVNWEIEPKESAPEEDLVYNFDENCYYVDLGYKQFEDLYKDQKHIVKVLSKYNQQTDLFMNQGGYLNKIALNVLPYNKRIKDTFNPKFLITFGKRQAALGTFEDGKCVVCINQDAIAKANAEKLMTIPLDSEGYLNADSELIDNEAQKKIISLLLLEYKKQNIFCDSFELLDFLEQKMKLHNFFHGGV